MGIWRPKSIDPEFIYELWQTRGQVYRLHSDNIPFWLNRFEYVYASGDSLARTEEWSGRPIANIVGGIDVFRIDPKDFCKGITYNKDHYAVTSDNLIQAYGPFRKDGDHWYKDLPADLIMVEWL